MKYLSTFEIAEKWGISPRRVGVLCSQSHPRRTASRKPLDYPRRCREAC